MIPVRSILSTTLSAITVILSTALANQHVSGRYVYLMCHGFLCWISVQSDQGIGSRLQKSFDSVE